MKFGKLAKKTSYKTIKFKKYVLDGFAAPPPAFSTLDRVYKNLGISDPTVLFPMDGNDSLGDCSFASACHASTTWNGMVGVKHIPTDCDKEYLAFTGGQDNGCALLDVLNHWHNVGIAGSKILGFAEIDSKNHDHVKLAIKEFGLVYSGFQVPDNCMDQFNAGQAWTGGTLLNEGHAVSEPEYDENGLTNFTWGTTQKGTWGWWDECVDECYCVIPRVALLNAFQGIDYATMVNDLKLLAA